MRYPQKGLPNGISTSRQDFAVRGLSLGFLKIRALAFTHTQYCYIVLDSYYRHSLILKELMNGLLDTW